jgi:hypothetical protein
MVCCQAGVSRLRRLRRWHWLVAMVAKVELDSCDSCSAFAAVSNWESPELILKVMVVNKIFYDCISYV